MAAASPRERKDDLPAGDEHASYENGHIEWLGHFEELFGQKSEMEGGVGVAHVTVTVTVTGK